MSDDENTKPLRVYRFINQRGDIVDAPLIDGVWIEYDAKNGHGAIRESFNARGHWYFGKLIFDALRGIKK